MEEYENMARNNMEEYENQARNRAIIRWAGQRFDAATFRRIINIGRRAGPRAGDQDIQEEYDPNNPGYDPVDLNNGFFPLSRRQRSRSHAGGSGGRAAVIPARVARRTMGKIRHATRGAPSEACRACSREACNG